MINNFINIILAILSIIFLFIFGAALIAIIDSLFFSSGEHPGRMSGACGDGSGAHESGGGCEPEEDDDPDWVL